MRQDWVPLLNRHCGGPLIVDLAQTTDVYIGVAPRMVRAGGASAVKYGWALWVDCDTDNAVDALQRFVPAPQILIASGTRRNLHGYWLLDRPLDGARLEGANRRLAAFLGADRHATDRARILRPPFTFNFKDGSPRPVHLTRFDDAPRLDPVEVLGRLPEDPAAESRCQPITAPSLVDDDPLRGLSARDYVPDLLGRPLRADGKTMCPFHPDDEPSLHAYAGSGADARGWWCFACGVGGSVYDLAARLWGLSTRGSDFLELRRRLLARYGLSTASR
jgi:hypothetical protein